MGGESSFYQLIETDQNFNLKTFSACWRNVHMGYGIVKLSVSLQGYSAKEG